ncbi:glycerol kinase [Russula aff. rugulosa BPL654]|nr:glycerol kinase [Russula aff. rugulosa BPL654]
MSALRESEFVGSLDCGTTSTRFIIFDQYANIVAQSQEEFPQYYPNPGWHEHDATEIQEVCDKVVEQAIVNLEEAGYKRSSVKVIGVTNQRETTVVWSRKTGKPLSRAIVWDDSRTRGVVAHYEHLLNAQGIMVNGQLRSGADGAEGLKELTGLPLSTYFSVIKLRWMIDNWEDIRRAHEADDLAFGTVESWIAYNLLGGRSEQCIRTLLLNIRTLEWDPAFYNFSEYGNRSAAFVSTSEGVPLGGLVGDQQGALIGNNQMHVWTGAFLLFCTGTDIVYSNHGLLSTVAYRLGSQGRTVYALEGAIAVAGSAIKWLRDSMKMIKTADEINTLARSVTSTSGVYFVTAFSGLLAPYWDPGATGLLANAFQTRAVIDSMKLDSKSELAHLKVDGGMTNGDVAMEVLADMGGFEVARPEMRESTALGSALLAGAAIGLFGWDLARPETLASVNTARSMHFLPRLGEEERSEAWRGWLRAVDRSRGWIETVE